MFFFDEFRKIYVRRLHVYLHVGSSSHLLEHRWYSGIFISDEYFDNYLKILKENFRCIKYPAI